MNDIKIKSSAMLITLRWIARVWSIGSIGIILLFFIGEGFAPAKVTPKERVRRQVYKLHIKFYRNCLPFATLSKQIYHALKRDEGVINQISRCELFSLFYLRYSQFANSVSPCQ
jgi:hypothetical protein